MNVQKKPVASPAVDSIDEIEKIMNEIEELQQGMSDEPASAMEEFKAGSGDVSLEETLANLKDDEPSGPNLIDQSIQAEAAALEVASQEGDLLEDGELLDDAEAEALQQAIEEEEAQITEAIAEEETQEEELAPVRHLPRRPESQAAVASVSLILAGHMTLKLSYEFEGQEVTVGFKDGALQVELSDGTEFKIPVRRNSLRKVG